MAEIVNKTNPLQREGANRDQRLLPLLDPANVKIDDRTEEDLITLSRQLAEILNFYNSNDDTISKWSNFLPGIQCTPEGNVIGQKDFEPHVALFLAFLKLYRHCQDHLNILTARHLDFFYSDVLKMALKEAKPDSVHVIFELKKNVSEQKIDKDSVLLAGKDESGKPVRFKLVEDIIVNTSKVAHIRSLFNSYGKLHYSLISNSKDGWGEDFDSPDEAWDLFGNESLPVAQTGFAISSPVFQLSGGTRTVTLSFSVNTAKSTPGKLKDDLFLKGLTIYASGEKNWLGPFEARPADSQRSLTGVLYSEKKLIFSFIIPKGEGVVSNYNESVFLEHFNTSSPVVKVFISDQVMKSLDGMILNDIKITVSVTDFSGLAVETDFGPVDPSKPFQPFGPLPKKDNSLYLGSGEVFSRKISDLKIKIRWQDLPADFKKRYSKYPVEYQEKHNYKAGIYLLNDSDWKFPQSTELFPGDPDDEHILPAGDENKTKFGSSASRVSAFYVKNFKPGIYRKASQLITGGLSQSVLGQASFTGYFSKGKEIKPLKRFSGELKEGYLRLTLLHDFGHGSYYNIYADTIASNLTKEKPDHLPEPPYTPAITSLKLDYTAETGTESLLNDDEASFKNREIQFFHLYPFGLSEQHRFIKRNLDIPSKTVTLVPSYPNKGELYIGLLNAEPLQVVNLLFQLSEGSADPDLPNQRILWSVLTGDHWKPLDSGNIICDTTNGLLETGIIKFLLPRDSSTDNVLMDPGYTWIRGSTEHDPASVCKALAVYSQAVKAERENLTPLDTLAFNTLKPGKISSLENEIGSIKSILQPYSSFGGRAGEKQLELYSRVSERIRHKNRASNIWDFERMILEQFPFVYKAKCLNHTGSSGSLSPGEVTVIVIPELRNRNSVDLFKPRLSAASLSNIKTYLEGCASGFVKIHVENPDFEEIIVSASVKFVEEPAFYSKQLSEDLKAFLSPWAFVPDSQILFSGRVHVNDIIFFMEQQSYVDYVENAFLSLKTSSGITDNLTEIVPSGDKVILVTAKNHNIIQL